MTETNSKVITLAGEALNLEARQLSRTEKATLTRHANRARQLRERRDRARLVLDENCMPILVKQAEIEANIAEREAVALRLIDIAEDTLAETRAQRASLRQQSRRKLAASPLVILEVWRRAMP